MTSISPASRSGWEPIAVEPVDALAAVGGEAGLPAASVLLSMCLRRVPEDATEADCQAVRRALEPLVCREAARDHGPADICALREILAAMESRLDEPASYVRWTWVLLRRIAEICRNAPLRSSYIAMLDFLADCPPENERGSFWCRRNLELQREVVAALEVGGPRLEHAVAAHAAAF